MKLGLQSLEERREAMRLKFAKQCLKVEKMKGLFPRKVNGHDMMAFGFLVMYRTQED